MISVAGQGEVPLWERAAGRLAKTIGMSWRWEHRHCDVVVDTFLGAQPDDDRIYYFRTHRQSSSWIDTFLGAQWDDDRIYYCRTHRQSSSWLPPWRMQP